MHRRTLVFVLLALLPSGLPAQTGSARRIGADIAFLAADAQQGRGIGTAGLEASAEYIARTFARIGLSQPFSDGYFQAFTIDSTAPVAAHTGIGGAAVKNVVGVLPGRGSLAGQVIVVGAHYDHLGLGGPNALDPDSTGIVHNGADDNASGTAAMMEVARLLRGRLRGDRRTIVFVAFTAEEEGVIGSTYYVRHPVFPMDSTVTMLNFDMVGRLRNDRLLAMGAETAPEFTPLLDSLNGAYHFDLQASGDGWGPSDQSSFYAAKVPVIQLFTDLHSDYHRTTDDYATINTEGEARIASYAADLAVELATRPTRPTYTSIPRPEPPRGGTRPWLGTVPDMSGSPGGVRITGVTAGSPAAEAGLQGGDVLIKLGEFDIANLNDLQNALVSHKAGDVVQVVVHRGDETKTFTVTLRARG
jgi:Zn-dependent M28 family amino/carboxypeptidase